MRTRVARRTYTSACAPVMGSEGTFVAFGIDPPVPGPSEGEHMRVKPTHLIWGVGALMVVAILVYQATSNPPGKRVQDGDLITQTISTVEPNATATFDITLQEGGDAAHEADHVFKSIDNMAALASATFNTKTLTLEVRYDSSQISEAGVRQLLVTAGYVRVSLADTVLATLTADGTSQELSVETGDVLYPALLGAKAGIPLRIAFGPGSGHLASIRIVELGIEQDLSQGGATVVVENPQPGTYEIICADGYADGRLIIE